MTERLLRAAAIAIAVLAAIDPTVSVTGAVRPRISIVVEDGVSMRLPDVSGATRLAVAERVRDTLRADLGHRYEFVNGDDGLSLSAVAAVVIGDRYPARPLPESLAVSTVTIADGPVPNARIADVEAPASILPATAVPIRVAIDASGLRGATTTVTVRSEGAVVAHSSHTWTSDRDAWTATLDAVPIGVPPYTFGIAAESTVAERTTVDNHASVQVDRRPPARVLVYEARPSWAAAFVRRALESDPRLSVSGVSDPSPRARVRTGAAGDNVEWPLTQLGRFDAIVVGGLDRLSRRDVDVLDRFMRERGGSVALLPDAKPPAATLRPLVGDVTLQERLLDVAISLAAPGLRRLDAGELLDGSDVPGDAQIVARDGATNRPVIWMVGRESGRVLFSGAMDAWRYRARPGVEFDRVWRSAIAGLAIAAQPPVEVTLSPPRAADRERVEVTVRVRALELNRNATVAVSARSGHTPVRLWPTARRGIFTGSFVVDRAALGASALVTAVALDGSNGPSLEGSARLTLDDTPREAPAAPLSLLARTHGGVDVRPDGLRSLERHVQATVQGASTRAMRRPMRSPWWIVPFAAALSGEWWLRRRRGSR